MVEFNFNINSLFPEEISIITTDLIPKGYNGDSNYALLKRQVKHFRENKKININPIPNWVVIIGKLMHLKTAAL